MRWLQDFTTWGFNPVTKSGYPSSSVAMYWHRLPKLVLRHSFIQSTKHFAPLDAELLVRHVQFSWSTTSDFHNKSPISQVSGPMQF
jgi:hypothetical protein